MAGDIADVHRVSPEPEESQESSSHPSLPDITAQAETLLSSISTAWNTLHAIILRREETLRKRWMKKNKNARANVLLRAWPDMATRHRPEFWALAHPASKQQQPKKYTNAFKFPYINLEDLTEPRPLLLLLNSRARNSPLTFAHADVHAIRLGTAFGVIPRVVSHGCAMYMADRDTQATHGKFVSGWKGGDDIAAAPIHERLRFSVGDGILALEVEDAILTFLIRCCQEIFPELDLAQLASKDLPIQPEPQALTSQQTTFVQLSIVAQEAPYRAPAKINIRELKTQIIARKDTAVDHIWDLREDPAYFASMANEWGDHSPDRVLDRRRKRHPHCDDDIFWHQRLIALVVNAYCTFLAWQQLLDRVSAVEQAMPSKLDPGAPLPSQLESAFLELLHVLGVSISANIDNFQAFLGASPSWRASFIRITNDRGQGTKCLEQKVVPAPGCLLHSVYFLQESHFYFLSITIDEIQRLLDERTGDRDKLSALVSATFSDLALMSQVLLQVETFFPWAAGFKKLGSKFESVKLKQEKDDFKYLCCLAAIPTSMLGLVMPFHKKCQYPADKASTEANIRQMREAELNLDNFWKAVDDVFARPSCHTFDIHAKYNIPRRKIYRTPEYRPQPADRGGGSTLAIDRQLTNITNLSITPSEPLDQPRRLITEPATEKVKSRPDAKQDTPKKAEHVETHQLPSHGSETKISVSKRALKVFRTLFYISGEQDQAGEIPWSEFLHAMSSAGCSIEKLRGSVWQFVPKERNASSGHGIHFHEPHPGGKLSFTMARRIGRRLGRNFGWSAETFTSARSNEA